MITESEVASVSNEDKVLFSAKNWPGLFGIHQSQIVSRQMRELSAYASGAHDDQVIALVGGLIVEDSIDRILSALMPKYKRLAGIRDVSFSTKTEILRAMNLIENQLLKDADFIRKVRNEFAHNLEVSKFDDLVNREYEDSHGKKRQYLVPLRDRHARRATTWKNERSESYGDLFMGLAKSTANEILGYSLPAHYLNSYIRRDGFMDEVYDYVRTSGSPAYEIQISFDQSAVERGAHIAVCEAVAQRPLSTGEAESIERTRSWSIYVKHIDDAMIRLRRATASSDFIPPDKS